MMIRPLEISDISAVKEIHERYFNHEFNLPDFEKFIASFAMTNVEDRIVSVGGIRPILEMVSLTDKDLSIFLRRSAYFNILSACLYMAEKHKFDQIHVFAQGDRWIEALKKVGFRNTKGTALVMDVER